MFNYPIKPSKPRVQMGPIMAEIRKWDWFIQALKNAENVPTAHKTRILSRIWTGATLRHAITVSGISPEDCNVETYEEIPTIIEYEQLHQIFRLMIDQNGNEVQLLIKTEDAQAVIIKDGKVEMCDFNTITPKTQYK